MPTFPPAAAPTVRVTLLRRLGRRVKTADQHFLGTIQDHWTESDQVVTMRTGLPLDEGQHYPPDLHHPTLAQISGRRVRLLGFESIDGAAYAQEWMIEYLEK